MQPASIDDTLAQLAAQRYFASRELATALYLALRMERPLFVEGEPGVGKTELAKAAAGMLGTSMLRLQCYEGLDTASALYEWDYPRQIMALRLAEAAGERRPQNMPGTSRGESATAWALRGTVSGSRPPGAS